MDAVIDLTSDEDISQSQNIPTVITPVATIAPISTSEVIQISDSDSDSDESDPEPENETESREPLIQLGRGKYRNLKFRQVECKRAFKNAVLCRSFEPVDQVHDLDSVLNWIKKQLMLQLPPLLVEYHGLCTWVSMLNTYENI